MPELGIPQLMGFLKAKGIPSRHRDLNQAFIHSFLPKLKKPDGTMDRAVETLLSTQSFELSEFQQSLSHDNPLYEKFFALYFLNEFLKSPAPVVGMAILDVAQLYPAALLVRCIKKAAPKTTIVWGGAWVTAAYELLPSFMQGFRELDGCIPFGGERPLLELLHAIESGSDFSQVANVVWRGPAGVTVNPLLPAVPLDEIPTPDFDDFNLRDYRAAILPVATQSGCYWGNCVFCQHHVDALGAKRRSAQKVADSLEELSLNYQVRHFFLADSCTSPTLMEGLAKALIRKGLDLHWSCMARIEPIYTEEFCRLLYAGGCRYLFFGLESTSPEFLARVQKGIDPNDTDMLLKNCKLAGIAVNLFVIDIPSLPIEQVKATLDWICRRKELVTHTILQRFVLSRNSKVFRDPALLDITIPPQALSNLNVFNLPYIAQAPTPESEFKRLSDEFDERFFVPELAKKRAENPMRLCQVG